MRSSGMVVAALMLLGTSFCSTRETATNCSDYGSSPSAYTVELAGRAGGVTQQDRSFVCQAAIDGLAREALSQMAEQKAQDPAVRVFAGNVVADQTFTSGVLERLATQQVGLAPPNRLDPIHAAMLDRFASLGSADFDRAYIQQAVADYWSAIQNFQWQAWTGSEPTLQRFAAYNLPLLANRLLSAQRIESQLETSPAKPS